LPVLVLLPGLAPEGGRSEAKTVQYQLSAEPSASARLANSQSATSREPQVMAAEQTSIQSPH
jgi:hypothetical protein